jgi:hypothetical protein
VTAFCTRARQRRGGQGAGGGKTQPRELGGSRREIERVQLCCVEYSGGLQLFGVSGTHSIYLLYSALTRTKVPILTYTSLHVAAGHGEPGRRWRWCRRGAAVCWTLASAPEVQAPRRVSGRDSANACENACVHRYYHALMQQCRLRGERERR